MGSFGSGELAELLLGNLVLPVITASSSCQLAVKQLRGSNTARTPAPRLVPDEPVALPEQPLTARARIESQQQPGSMLESPRSLRELGCSHGYSTPRSRHRVERPGSRSAHALERTAPPGWSHAVLPSSHSATCTLAQQPSSHSITAQALQAPRTSGKLVNSRWSEICDAPAAHSSQCASPSSSQQQQQTQPSQPHPPRGTPRAAAAAVVVLQDGMLLLDTSVIAPPNAHTVKLQQALSGDALGSSTRGKGKARKENKLGKELHLLERELRAELQQGESQPGGEELKSGAGSTAHKRQQPRSSTASRHALTGGLHGRWHRPSLDSHPHSCTRVRHNQSTHTCTCLACECPSVTSLPVFCCCVAAACSATRGARRAQQAVVPQVRHRVSQSHAVNYADC